MTFRSRASAKGRLDLQPVRFAHRTGPVMRQIESPLVHPFAGFDIPALVAARAGGHPDKPWLVWEPFNGPREVWTFGEFAHEVDRIAAGLAARGIRAGDSVLVHLDNCPEILFAWFACARIGAICVTTNARSAADEMTYFADHSGAVAAITQPKFAAMIGSACRDLRWVAVTETDNGEAPAPGSAPGDDSFARLAGNPADAPCRPADPMAPLSVQFTSGTTSRPKAVLWLHGNGLWGAKMNAVHEDLREDRQPPDLPADLPHQRPGLFRARLAVGGRGLRGPAALFGPPVLGRGGAQRLHLDQHGAVHEPGADGSRRTGEPYLPPDGQRHLQPADRRDIRRQDDRLVGHDRDHHPGLRRRGPSAEPAALHRQALGRIRIRILDEAGDPVGPDETGDLFIRGVRGLSMFAEYLGNEKATAESFDEEGFFTTGDKITVHDDGFCSFADRAKDMLKVGGENVAASEVERVIAEQPLAREVAVVAGKHPMLDEVPVAYILVDGGAANAPPDYGERIIAACRRSLAEFKVPREVRLVDDFPRSTVEKIAKNVLRAELEADGAGEG